MRAVSKNFFVVGHVMYKLKYINWLRISLKRHIIFHLCTNQITNKIFREKVKIAVAPSNSFMIIILCPKRENNLFSAI